MERVTNHEASYLGNTIVSLMSSENEMCLSRAKAALSGLSALMTDSGALEHDLSEIGAIVGLISDELNLVRANISGADLA